MTDTLTPEERQDACPECGRKAVVLWRLDADDVILECDRCDWFIDLAQHNAQPGTPKKAQHFDGSVAP